MNGNASLKELSQLVSEHLLEMFKNQTVDLRNIFQSCNRILFEELGDKIKRKFSILIQTKF